MTAISSEEIAAKRRRNHFGTGLILLIANAAILALWAMALLPMLAQEDGILETLQLLLAASAAGSFALAAQEDDGAVGSAGAAIAAMLLIGIAREIDVRTMIVPDWMMVWSQSLFRDTIVGGLFVLVLIYAWFRRSHFDDWLSLVFRWRAWPFWLSGAMFIIAVFFEKIIGGQIGRLLEELAETNGYLLLTIAGWRHCSLLLNRNEI